MMPGPAHISREDPYQRLLVNETLSSLVAATKRNIEKVRSAMRVLPPVKEDGSSDCPFAEQLFYKKEKAARELQARCPSLQECLGAVEQECAKRNRERGRIGADARAVMLPESQNHYQDALAAQNARCREVAQQRQELAQLITQVEHVLQEAAKEKWPLGEPRGATPGDAGAPEKSEGPGGQYGGSAPKSPTASSFGPELDGLLHTNQVTPPPWGSAGSKS